MNVRVMLIAALALQGCDWAAGERIARCNAGDLSQCDDAGLNDAGTSDAGTSDAGMSDAGPSDAGPSDAGPGDAGPGDAGARDAGDDAGARDAGVDAGPVMTTFGLYPNVAGGLWHVFNEGGRGVVQVVADDGGVPRALRLGGAVVQAYADSPTSTWLALLVDTAGASSLVVVDPFDGGTFETQASADIISVFQSPLGVDTVSLWSSSGRYQQDLLAPVAVSRTFIPTPLGNEACAITFDDLEVLRPPMNRVVIAHRAGTCPAVQGTVSEGVVSDGGIQFITAAGDRGSIAGHPVAPRQRVGRTSTGFNIATQSLSIATSKYVWNAPLMDFSLTGCASIAPVMGSQLELGDVSDGYVTGLVNGGLIVGMSNATLPTVPEPTAFLARVCDTTTPWVEALGPATLGARVPVLVQDGRVFVSVQRPDGGVELLSRDAGS